MAILLREQGIEFSSVGISILFGTRGKIYDLPRDLEAFSSLAGDCEDSDLGGDGKEYDTNIKKMYDILPVTFELPDAWKGTP